MDSSISGDVATPVATGDDTGTPRTRVRTVLACNPCRRKKVKCNGTTPCQKCIAARKEQNCVYGTHSRGHSARAAVARPLAPRRILRATSQGVGGQDRRNLSTAGQDDPVANKKQQELRAGIAAFNSDTHAYQFYGPSSHFSFVQRLYKRIRRQSHQPLMLEVHQRRVPDGLRQYVRSRTKLIRRSTDLIDPDGE